MLRVRAETMVVSTKNHRHKAAAVHSQVVFGRVSVALDGDTGTVTLAPGFGDAHDEQDWNGMVRWAWHQGFTLRFGRPSRIRPDGSEVYQLERYGKLGV